MVLYGNTKAKARRCIIADRQLSTILNSGEINTIFLGGINSEDKAVKQSELTTAVQTVDDKEAINTANIATNTQDIIDANATIGINAGNISTNASDISNNAAAIIINATDIDGIIDGSDVIIKTQYSNILPNPAHIEGTHFYDNNKHIVSSYTDIPGVTANGVLEDFVRMEGNQGVTILNGQPVYFDGSISAGNIPRAKLAKTDSFLTSNSGGIATHDIANGVEGWITSRGTVDGLDIPSLTETGITLLAGEKIYISELEAGKYTNVPPSLPSRIGVLIKAGIDGIIFVAPVPVENDIIIYAFMQELIDPTYILAGGATQAIGGYIAANSDNLLLPYNEVTGTIDVALEGAYDVTVYLDTELHIGDIPGQNNSVVILVEIYNANDPVGFNVPMYIHFAEFQVHATSAITISKKFLGTEQLAMRISSTTDLSVDLREVLLDVKSRKLR